MKKLDVKTVIYKEGDYYVAQSLGVEVSSFGKTKQEAAKNIQEALELYFDGASSVLDNITDAEITTTTLSHA